jgi:hypothetical protein
LESYYCDPVLTGTAKGIGLPNGNLKLDFEKEIEWAFRLFEDHLP